MTFQTLLNKEYRSPRRVFIALLFPLHQHVQCQLYCQIYLPPPATTPESSLSAPLLWLALLNQQLHNRYPDDLRYLRVHLCEKLILIRHSVVLFDVF